MLPTEYPTEQEVLTVSDAARLFHRSTSWVRDEITGGRLRTLHPAGVRPVLITGASAKALHRLIREKSQNQKTSKPPLLRLVVDNTK